MDTRKWGSLRILLKLSTVKPSSSTTPLFCLHTSCTRSFFTSEAALSIPRLKFLRVNHKTSGHGHLWPPSFPFLSGTFPLGAPSSPILGLVLGWAQDPALNNQNFVSLGNWLRNGYRPQANPIYIPWDLFLPFLWAFSPLCPYTFNAFSRAIYGNSSEDHSWATRSHFVPTAANWRYPGITSPTFVFDELKKKFIDIYFTYHRLYSFKCTVQCFIVYTQIYATILTVSFRIFLSFQKETLYPLAITPLSPTPAPSLS